MPVPDISKKLLKLMSWRNPAGDALSLSGIADEPLYARNS